MHRAIDATINEGLNDNSKTAVGQAVAASVDALKRLTNDALAYARGFEITRPAPAHSGRDVHSPQSGPYSYSPQASIDTLRHAVETPATMPVDVDVDGALRKVVPAPVRH